MEKRGRVPLDGRLAKLVGREWQTAAEIQRLSGGETLEVAKTLDRLWESGLIERETLDIGIGARRKVEELNCAASGTGANFRNSSGY